MKLLYRSMFALCLMMFVLPIQAFAVDYSIEEMKIDAQLQEDGNVEVTEEQTYTFDGKFNGIIRTLIPKEDTDIKDVRATENNKELTVEQDENEYKILRKGKDETVTIELSYQIENGVAVYSDVADFSWAFFDSGNDSDYEKFSVTIHPPTKTTNVITYGDDLAFDSEEIKESGTVEFDLGHVASGKNGDIRVAYDAALFKTAQITADKLMRKSIESDKQAVIDSHNKFENTRESLSNFAPYVLGVLTIIFISIIFFARQRYKAVRNEVSRKYPTPYFVPEETMSLPATIVYMNFNLANPEILSAALMDLVRIGYVEEVDKNTFKVVNRKTVYQHELLLINWLFDKVGNEGIFKIEDLEAYTSIEANQQTYQEDYQAWQKAVRDEILKTDLFSTNMKERLIMAMVGVLIIPLIIYLGIYDLYMYMTFAIVLAILFLAFATFYKTRTILGAKIKRDWQAFQEKYPLMAEEEWEELETDDQKRAFIYGIGITDKKIDEKNKVLIESFPTDSYLSSPANMLIIAAIVSSNFNHAESTSAASGSTSAGGGTGVGGGGGGSGAF